MTNRNSTMIAPAYTMIWTTNRNGDPRTRKKTARVKKLTIRRSAAWTAFRWKSRAAAESTEIGASTQNTTRSATGYLPSSVPGDVPSAGGGSRSCSFVKMPASRDSKASS